MNRHRAFRRAKYVYVSFLSCLLFSCIFFIPPHVSQALELKSPQEKTLSEPETKWGIEIIALRPTAAGHMLDLRYRVTDPVKARDILDKRQKAYIVDQKSGKALPVPVTKAGPLRQTTLQPEAGRIYFVLFSNPAGLVKEGSNVTVIIGDFSLEDIPVEGLGIPASVKNQ